MVPESCDFLERDVGIRERVFQLGETVENAEEGERASDVPFMAVVVGIVLDTSRINRSRKILTKHDVKM